MNAQARQVEAPTPQAAPYQAILENALDGFLALDGACRCIYANKAAAAFLGTTTERLIGRPMGEALPAARDPKLRETIEWAAEQRVFAKCEEYCEQCGRWYEWRCCPSADGLAITIVDASERKEVEEQVARSEQHYRLLFETMPQGVVYQDAEGKIISMNPAAERILGRTPEEYLGRTSVDEEYHTLRDDGTPFPGLEHPSMVALRTGQEVPNVVMGVFNPRDRAYHWINITAVPLARPGEDRPYQVYTHFSDITELRQAERSLRHSERRFRKLFEARLMGIFITRTDGTFLDCNEAMAQMLGYDSRAELLHHHSTELYVDPAFRAEAIQILQTEGIYLGKEGRVWRKDGSIAHLLGAAVLLQDEETGEPYIQGVAVDVTERRHAEEALRQSEDRYRKLFEANLAGVYITKLDGTIVDFNTAMMKMLGYDSRAELLQKRSTDLYADPEFRKELVRLIQEKGVVVGREAVLQRKDGSILYAHGAAALLRDERTGDLYIQGVVVDITERKRAEEALRESEARYRKLFEANMAGVYLAALDGTVLDFNEAMMKMLGYDSRAEVFRHRVPDFYVAPEVRLELIRQLRQQGTVQDKEVLLRKKDGSTLCALGSAALLTDERTGEPYILGVAQDVTERIEAEKALARSVQDLEFLSTSALHYLEALPSAELFRYTAQQLQAVAGRAVIVVSEYDPATRQTTVRSMAGPEDKLRRLPLLLGRDPVGLAFTVTEGTLERASPGRLELLTGGLRELTFFQMPRPLATWIEQELGLGEIYAMPFALGEDYMGTVALGTDRAEGLQNRELTEAIVNHAALALKRTRTEEALRESKERLAEELTDTQLLQGISAELIQQDQIVALYERILDAAVAIMHSDYASLQMVYPDPRTGGKLRLLAAHGLSPQAAQFWEQVRTDSESTCGVALRTGRRVVVPDVEQCRFMVGTPDRQMYLQTGIRAAQTTPLRSRTGKMVGMLSTHWRHPHEPSERDWRLLDILARQAADLIEQRQAEEALRESNATLESRVAQRTAELEYRTHQLQRMTLEVSQAEDRERQRLAEILHDDLQQIVAGAKFHLNLLRRQLRSDADLHELALEIDRMLKEAIDKSRNLSHELSPVMLQQGDVTETLRWLADQIQVKHGLTVHVQAEGRVDLQAEAAKTFLYKTAQELLFNVVKHARVKEATVRVRRCGSYVCLLVSDRGRGFDPQELHQAVGYGLLSIRERVELLGGRMKIRSTKGQGSVFSIVLPDKD